MNQIALVSVTPNAIFPIMDCLNEKNDQLKIVNYLDSFILKRVGLDGGEIKAAPMGRMFDMLVKAKDDGADCIILTCTIFSPYADTFSELLKVPVICPDGAMLDNVTKTTGKTVLLFTFDGTVATTRSQYRKYQEKNGKEGSVDCIVVEGAFDAANNSEFEKFDQLISDKVKELDGEYDNIVLSQITMARAAKTVKTKHARVWTSPDSAAEAAIACLK